MKRMQVGIYTSSLTPSSGGGFTFEDNLIHSLAEKNSLPFDTTVFFYGDRPPEKTRGQIRFVSLGSRKHLSNLIFKFVRPLGDVWNRLARKFFPNAVLSFYGSYLEKVAAENEIDLLWSLTPNMEPTRNIPYFLTLWDLEHRNQPYFPEISENGIWEGRENQLQNLIQKAACVITGTQVGAAQLERFYGISRERILVNPFPVPSYVKNEKLSNTFVSKETKLRISNQPYFFYPAQFWPHKNHYRIMMAMAELNRRSPVHCVFTGSDKGNQSKLETLRDELGLKNFVHFLGFVPQSDLVALYKNAVALVFPSFGGPDNLPPLEALSLNCPVIASRFPGSEEQLGDSAILVDPENTKEWVQAMEDLMKSTDKRKALTAKGQEKIRDLSPEKYIDKIHREMESFEQRWRCWS